MNRPQSPQEWQAFHEQQARKQEAQRNRDERAAAKEGPPKFDLHPLLFDRHNAPHEREAERIVAETQARWRAERQRLASPHPLTQAPYVHIPIPDRAQKSKAKASEPVMPAEHQALLNEAARRARKQK
jgi:hypothetical protein